MYDRFILQQLCSPWGRPQYSDTMCQQFLLAAYTGKSLSGATSPQNEVSLKESRRTPQLLKEFDMYHRMDMYLTGILRSETVNNAEA